MSARPASAALAALLALGACGGGDVETEVTNVLVPVARQRADLERAHALGVITDDELRRALAGIGR